MKIYVKSSADTSVNNAICDAVFDEATELLSNYQYNSNLMNCTIDIVGFEQYTKSSKVFDKPPYQTSHTIKFIAPFLIRFGSLECDNLNDLNKIDSLHRDTPDMIWRQLVYASKEIEELLDEQMTNKVFSHVMLAANAFIIELTHFTD